MAQRDGYGTKASNTLQAKSKLKKNLAAMDINNISRHYFIFVDKFHFNHVEIDKSIY